MKCPACFNELRQVQVGPVVVDVCDGGCGGIWFDAFELQKVDQQTEAAGEHLLDIQRDPRVTVDPSRKRACPRCEGIKLYRHLFSAKRPVEVDECPNCGGYWLDAGELASIRAENKPADTPLKLSPETIRYLYNLHQSRRTEPSSHDTAA